MSATSTLLVKILGDASGLKRVLGGASGAASKFSASMKGIGSSMTDTGRKMRRNVTAPIVAGFAAIGIAATSWETAFTGVRKTVDGSEADFAALEKSLLNLSKVVPIKPTQIAQIAELGGQLGITKDEIVGFTKVVADLGASTNLSFEAAAVGIAQFINVTEKVAPAGQSASEAASRIGAAIVDLGNNFATTESAIMEFSRRIAGTGAVIGMSREDILGWSAAMASMGIQAEMGGSAFSRTLQNMNADVANQTSKLETWAKTAGMSVETFSTLFEQDASKALEKFLVGLNGIDKEGGNVIGVLSDLGIEGLRQTDVLLKLAGNTELMGDALKTAGSAFSENSALTEEAAKRYETFASQMTFLKNEAFAVGVELGNTLIPVLRDLITSLKPFISAFAEFARANPEIVKMGMKFAALAAVLGPLLMIVGQVVTAVGAISGAFSAASGIITTIFGLFGGGSAILAGLGAAFSALAAPVAIAIAVIAALYLAWQTNFLGIRDIAAAWWEYMKGIFEGVKNIVTTVWAYLKGEMTFAEMIAKIKIELTGLLTTWKTLWAKIGAILTEHLGSMIAKGVSLMMTLKSRVIAILGDLAGAAYGAGVALATRFGDGIRNALSAALDAARAIAQKIRDLLPGSDAKKGPLSDLFASGAALPTHFAKGIMSTAGAAGDAMLAAISPNAGGLTPAYATGGRGYGRGGPPDQLGGAGGPTIIINNPRAQAAEDSISDAMRRISWGLS